MVHPKYKPNCLALNKIQNTHFNNVRVVVQSEKNVVKVELTLIHF